MRKAKKDTRILQGPWLHRVQVTHALAEGWGDSLLDNRYNECGMTGVLDAG